MHMRSGSEGEGRKGKTRKFPREVRWLFFQAIHWAEDDPSFKLIFTSSLTSHRDSFNFRPYCLADIDESFLIPLPALSSPDFAA